jgi:exonuclease SbcC
VAEVNAAYLVRHGATHAEVLVGFEGPGHRYEIFLRFRRLRRKGQETFEAERIRFTENGAGTAYSATELRQRVIDLLGFPDNPSPQAHSDLWRWAVYVPQERMRDILGARPQERLETVRKALGVEQYRTAAENAQGLSADLRRSAVSRRAEADRLHHYEEQFAEGSARAAQLREERDATERSLRVHETELAARERARAELESSRRHAEADVRELAGLEREQETDARSLEELLRVMAEQTAQAERLRSDALASGIEADALEARRTALSAAREEVARLRKEIERRADHLRSLAEARALVASAEHAEVEAKARLDPLRSEADDAKRAHEAALAEGPAKEPPAPTPRTLAALDARLVAAREAEAHALQATTQAESSLGEIEELLRAGVCPRCQQPVRPTEYEPHRAEALALAKDARAHLEATEQDRKRIEEERRARERYERSLDRWNEVEKRRAMTREAHDRAMHALEEAERAAESAKRSVAASRKRLDDLLPEEERASVLRAELARAEQAEADRSRDLEKSVVAREQRRGTDRILEGLETQRSRSQREAATLRGRIEARVERRKALRGATEGMEALRLSADRAERELVTLQEQLNADRKAAGSLESQLESALERVREAETRRRERAELLAEASDLEEKAVWVGDAFRTTVLEMEKKLLTHAQAIFEREFARYFASLVDDPALVARTDPAFTPLVMIEGEWTPAEALSGGERTSLALAFRLALAHVVRSMGSLHLDTILLDEPTDGFSPEQVIRMGELLEELALPQVIIVSHESQLAAIADRVVRVRKVDGRSFLEGGPALPDESSEGPSATLP